MNRLLHILLFSLPLSLFAGPGDTTWVRSHDRVHMNWYGNFDRKAEFPDPGKSYSSIKMHYTLGCPDKGCSEWDYTTQIFLRQYTGKTDSTEHKSPNFRIDGSERDSFFYNTDSTYTYFFNTSTNAIDSLALEPVQLIRFLDAQNPLVATDTLHVWDALIYRPAYDVSGNVIDSVRINFQNSIHKSLHIYYTKYEVVNNLELGRVITPYAGDRDKNWSYTYTFDVTDFAYLLRDSVEIRAHYSGYQDGFTVTLDFEFTEGIPAMECYKIEPVYQGGFPYGNPNNSIENYIKAHQFTPDANAKEIKFRVIQTGHGFGGNENCAEFCAKSHYVKINGSQKYSGLVWKDNCGLNPIYPQTGTWLYDRANWCPGSAVDNMDYFIGAHVNTGQANTLDLDMEPFTNINNNSCSYIISGMLFYYKEPSFKTDAVLEEILAPNDKINYGRLNPICGLPRFRVSNSGSEEITFLLIKFGVENGKENFYDWQGSIKFNESKEIQPNYPDWSGAGSGKFSAEIISVNGKEDEVKHNNSLQTGFTMADQMPKDFIVYFRSNNRSGDNSWTIRSVDGTLRAQSGAFTANTNHLDTVHLALGCYVFEFTDNSKNGISFWANNDGSGILAFRGVGSGLLKSFLGDFGTLVRYEFTVDYQMSQAEQQLQKVEIYPNPARTAFNIIVDYSGETNYELLDVNGRVLQKGIFELSTKLDVANLPPAIYWIKLNNTGGSVVKKVVVGLY